MKPDAPEFNVYEAKADCLREFAQRINRCNSEELPGTMFVYAVMPIFFTDFAVLYPALQQRCGPNTKINLEADSAEREIQLLQRIGSKIVAVFKIAYPDLELG